MACHDGNLPATHVDNRALDTSKRRATCSTPEPCCRSGTMQSAFFFLYNGTVCLAFFLMLGTVGWRSSLSFVRHIYRCSLMPCCYHAIQPSLRADRVSFILHRLALPDVQGHALPCASFEQRSRTAMPPPRSALMLFWLVLISVFPWQCHQE